MLGSRNQEKENGVKVLTYQRLLLQGFGLVDDYLEASG